jgi:predicted AAA+ superfamily ATPase
MKAKQLQVCQTSQSNNLNLPEVDKQKLLNMSVDEKENYVDELVIVNPKMQRIIDILEECKKSHLTCKQPECASIKGPRRSGKSTIAEEYQKKYPDYETEVGIVKPVFYSSVPCPANIGSLVTRLLYDINDPFYNKERNIGRNTHRLYDILKKCKVELIILDEVQHLVDRDKKKLLQESSDWFKDLIQQTGIPVAFIGLDESERIFLENEQLGGRVLNRDDVKPYTYDDIEFRAFLHIFDSSLPFKGYSGLSQPDLWQRIYLATDGYVGFIKALLKRATRIATVNELDYLTLPVLAQAYNNKLAFLGANPFVPGFDLQSAIKKLGKNTH